MPGGWLSRGGGAEGGGREREERERERRGEERREGEDRGKETDAEKRGYYFVGNVSGKFIFAGRSEGACEGG